MMFWLLKRMNAQIFSFGQREIIFAVLGIISFLLSKLFLRKW